MKKGILFLALLMVTATGFAQVYRLETVGPIDKPNNWFVVTDTVTGIQERPRLVGEVLAQINALGNIEVFRQTGVDYQAPIVFPNGKGHPYTRFIDGNNSDATFANAAAVYTWFYTNCFKSASGGSGADFANIAGVPGDNAALASALDAKARVTVVNVLDYGAIPNDGLDDLAAFNSATAVATAVGAKLFIPDGYFHLSDTWNIGLPAFTEYDFMVNRSAAVGDAIFDTYDIPANEIDNRDDYEAIDIEFSKGAFLVATWAPTNPEPVLAYHLKTDRDKGRRAKITGAQIISSDVFSGGVHNPILISVPVTNNLIGLYYDNKVSEIANTLISGCGYGIIEVNPFWTELTNAKIEWAKEAINTLQGNAHKINNIEMWRSTKGLLFNGDASSLTDIHTEQVEQEITIFKGDANLFGPMYLEDVSATDGTGKYAMTLGTTSDGNELTHSTFIGIRVGAARPNKGAFRIWGTRKATFIGSRAYSKTVTTDALSTGSLYESDFTAGTGFTSKDNFLKIATNPVDNQIVTSTGFGYSDGSANLTFDGTKLNIGGTSTINGISTISRTPSEYYITANAPRTDAYFKGIIGVGENGTAVNAGITAFDSGISAALGLSLFTGDNNGVIEAIKINSTGQVTIPVKLFYSPPVIAVTSSRNIASTDINSTLACTTTATLTITSSFSAMNVGQTINLEAHGTTFTILGGAGVTVNGVSTGSKAIGNGSDYVGGILRKTGTNTYVVF